MASIDKKTVQHLARLARIACTPEEEDALLQDLKNILDYIKQLDELDTKSIELRSQVIQEMQMPLRPDYVGEGMPREEFLANSPQHIGGMIRVPPVIKSS